MWYHSKHPLNLWLFSNNIKSESLLVQNFIMLHERLNDINLNVLINLFKSFFWFTSSDSGISALKSSCAHTLVRKFIFRIKIEKSRTPETQNWLPLSFITFIITIILKIYDFQFNAATCWAFILKRSFPFLLRCEKFIFSRCWDWNDCKLFHQQSSFISSTAFWLFINTLNDFKISFCGLMAETLMQRFITKSFNVSFSIERWRADCRVLPQLESFLLVLNFIWNCKRRKLLQDRIEAQTHIKRCATNH